MINNNTKEVILNGESYDLSFNFGVMKNICKETGLAMPVIIDAIQKLDAEVMYSVLLEGIRFNNPDFKEEILRGIGLTEMFTAFSTVAEILVDSMPKADNGTESKKTTPKKK
ncbi:hypothetical protein ACV3OI_07860 [Clostridium perfringens]